MREDYSKYLVKEYKYWLVNVHKNQGYLGRCVVYCKRNDALDLADATKEEQEELFMILKNVREALNTSFKPDWFNYSFLGNETKHLHGHVVPRYAQQREFNQTIFEDTLFGKHYKTDHNFVTSEETLQSIRKKLAGVLK